MSKREITIQGGLRADYVQATLPDGRAVQLSADGSIEVRQGGGHWNRYRLDLPTFEEVGEQCDPGGDGGEFTVTAFHAH